MFEAPVLNIMAILPIILIAITGLALMFIELWLPDDQKQLVGWLSLIGIAAAFVVVLTQWNHPEEAFFTAAGNPMVLVDNFSTFLNCLYLITAALSVLLAVGYIKRAHIERGEYYYLLLFSICGMMLMGMSNDLILSFLALELLSIPLYILSGFDRKRPESEESALKYFVLGAFSSGFLVFGIALIYGATGSTALPEISTAIASSGGLGMAGLAMLLVGFLFKVGAVPFHMWTPDVYEGAPTAVTAFMSVGAKIGGFAAMIRIFVGAFGTVSAEWQPAIAIIAALTMIVGNIAAITQKNIKRMLAYSSIAHAGYILMAVASGPEGVSASLYYMLTYLFTNLGAFAIVIAVERHDGKKGLMLDDYKGLAKRSPALALAMMYLMLSLIGIPLTGGFTGKFYVFSTAVDSGMIWLVVIAALTSVVSAFYYLRPVYYAFMYDGPGDAQSVTPDLSLALGVSVLATLLLGILPTQMYAIAQEAILPTITAVAGG